MVDVKYSAIAGRLTPCPFGERFYKGTINVGTIPCEMCRNHYHNNTETRIVTCKKDRK